MPGTQFYVSFLQKTPSIYFSGTFLPIFLLVSKFKLNVGNGYVLESNHTSYRINRRPAEATSVVEYVHYPLVVSLSISYPSGVSLDFKLPERLTGQKLYKNTLFCLFHWGLFARSSVKSFVVLVVMIIMTASSAMAEVIGVVMHRMTKTWWRQISFAVLPSGGKLLHPPFFWNFSPDFLAGFKIKA